MKGSIAIVAAAAAQLAAAQLSTASGGQYVVNYCTEDFQYNNVPASTAGADNASPTAGTLSANGGTYFQNWVKLDSAVSGGWSNKVALNDDWDNIYQFEYTWTDSEIWNDMSFVNGVESSLPAWELSCDGVAMSTNAYQYWNDDANGMQLPVSPDSTITLAFCPSNSGSVAASSTSAAEATTSAEAPATTAAPTETVASATTLATVASATAPAATTTEAAIQQAQFDSGSDMVGEVDIVTEYATAIVTAVVTETAVANKMHRRHEHRHPHGHTL